MVDHSRSERHGLSRYIILCSFSLHASLILNRALQSVIEFARKHMGTSDVRIDPKLNQELWSRGVKSVPHRLRLKLESTSPFSTLYLFI
jgi:hypothetical protein